MDVGRETRLRLVELGELVAGAFEFLFLKEVPKAESV